MLPWLRGRGVPAMAYSPVEQGRLLDAPALSRVAAAIGATPAQVALAWASRDGHIVIPRAGSVTHVRENRAAADLVIADAELAALDQAFPRPRGRRALEML